MIGYLVNKDFQRLWKVSKNPIVSVQIANMTNYCGVLVKILDDVVCLKHLVGSKQLHIDYRLETISVEKAEYDESGYSIGNVIMN